MFLSQMVSGMCLYVFRINGLLSQESTLLIRERREYITKLYFTLQIHIGLIYSFVELPLYHNAYSVINRCQLPAQHFPCAF